MMHDGLAQLSRNPYLSLDWTAQRHRSLDKLVHSTRSECAQAYRGSRRALPTSREPRSTATAGRPQSPSIPANTPRRLSGSSAAARRASAPSESHTPTRGGDTRDGKSISRDVRCAGPVHKVHEPVPDTRANPVDVPAHDPHSFRLRVVGDRRHWSPAPSSPGGVR